MLYFLLFCFCFSIPSFGLFQIYLIIPYTDIIHTKRQQKTILYLVFLFISDISCLLEINSIFLPPYNHYHRSLTYINTDEKKIIINSI